MDLGGAFCFIFKIFKFRQLWRMSKNTGDRGTEGMAFLSSQHEQATNFYCLFFWVGQPGLELSFVSEFSCPYIAISFMKPKPLFSSMLPLIPADCKPNLLYIYVTSVSRERNYQFYMFKLGNILIITIWCNLSHLSYRL